MVIWVSLIINFSSSLVLSYCKTASLKTTLPFVVSLRILSSGELAPPRDIIMPLFLISREFWSYDSPFERRFSRLLFDRYGLSKPFSRSWSISNELLWLAWPEPELLLVVSSTLYSRN